MSIYPSGTLIANRYEVVQGPREKPSLAGGMGLVYLCVDRAENGRPVALKTFRPELLSDRAARDRFLREGTTWVELGKHPHIVRCHQVFKADVGPEVFFVLELVAAAEGKRDASLRSWLTSGKPLSVEQALLFALHIARGMRHATAKIPELVHRDLKPENLLIGREGLLRVTDFGLATVTRSSSEGGGTFLYMAPEQWDQTNVDLRADIYAFGCILFEMLAGHPAVQPGSIPALKKAHQTGQVRALPADLSIEVTALIRQCMTVRPEARFSTWSEVESVVENTYPAKRGISDKVVIGKSVPIELTSQTELQSETSRFAGIERVTMGWSYNAMGVSYLDIGKSEVAKGYFERVLTIAVTEDDSPLEAAGLVNLGVSHKNLSNSFRAIQCFEQYLTIVRKFNDRYGEGTAMGNLGTAYADLGQVGRAIQFYEQHLAIAREIGDKRGEATALGNLGIAYKILGDITHAIKFHEKHLSIAREISDRQGEENALSNLGNIYMDLGRANRAIEFHEQHFNIAREIGDRRGEGSALGNLGEAHRRSGELTRAIEFFQQHLVIAREIGDRRGEGIALGNLGNAHAQLGDIQHAIELYRQRLTIAREIQDLRGELAALGNLGSAYGQLGESDQARGFFEQQLAIARKIGDRQGEGLALGNLGIASKNLDDPTRTIKFYEQSIKILNEIGDIMNSALFSYNFALLLAQLGRQIDALHYAEHAREVYTKAGHKLMLQRTQQLLSQMRT